MPFIIPSSLSDFIPTPIKNEATVIENTSDLFFAIGEVEAKQELPAYIIIRPDLVAVFDRILRVIEKYTHEELTLVEDDGITINGLDMHWDTTSLNEFLDITVNATEDKRTEVRSLTTKEEGTDDENDNIADQF